MLLNHFIIEYSKSNGLRKPFITEDAVEFLQDYPWPGNVRELKNTIETAIALSRNEGLDISSFLPLLRRHEEEENPARNLPVYLKRSPEEADRELLYRALFELKKDIMELKDIVIHNQNEVRVNEMRTPSDVVPLDQMEKEAIINALEITKGNKRNAAKLLNISERTLYRKIKEYDL